MDITLGERLKQLIKETKKEQQEVAAELGLKTPTFNGYISNKREPSIERLIQISRYFGISVDFLVGNSDIRDPYFSHLSEEIKNFVNESENIIYLELARDIKDKTLVTGKKYNTN